MSYHKLLKKRDKYLKYSKKFKFCEDDVCPICLEHLTNNTIEIVCGHTFHTHCLREWQRGTCPMCRIQFRDPLPQPDLNRVDSGASTPRSELESGEVIVYDHLARHLEFTS